MYYSNRHGQVGTTASADFNRALATSEAPRASELCDTAYRNYLSGGDTPAVAIRRETSRHTAAQAGGNDTTIATTRGDLIAEEKYRPTRPATDIALETHHRNDDGSCRPGWLHTYASPDDGGPDMIAYAFGGTGDVLVMPWSALKDAYSVYACEWWANALDTRNRNYSVAKHYDSKAQYTTVCLCVPVDEILRTVTCARLIRAEVNR